MNVLSKRASDAIDEIVKRDYSSSEKIDLYENVVKKIIFEASVRVVFGWRPCSARSTPRKNYDLFLKISTRIFRK